MTDSLFADLSANNSSFTAKSYAAAGHLAVSIKATEDHTYVSPPYARWVNDAHAHKLAVFHYHFARPEHGGPDAQAEHFWHTVKPHFRRPGDYVVVDVETGSPAAGKAFTTEYDKHLKKISGTHPVLYTFLSYFNEGNLTISSKRIWIAAWGSERPGSAHWDGLEGGQDVWAWQYTDGVNGPEPHSFAGISGSCDGSRLNPQTTKSLKAQLQALTGNAEPWSAVEPPSPSGVRRLLLLGSVGFCTPKFERPSPDLDRLDVKVGGVKVDHPIGITRPAALLETVDRARVQPVGGRAGDLIMAPVSVHSHLSRGEREVLAHRAARHESNVARPSST